MQNNTNVVYFYQTLVFQREKLWFFSQRSFFLQFSYAKLLFYPSFFKFHLKQYFATKKVI